MDGSQQGIKKTRAEQQAARAVDRRCLLACFAISIFLVVWITLASRSFNFRFVVFLFVLPWILLRAGGLVTAALRFPSFFVLDFLLGVAVVSIAVMVWKLLVPLSLWLLLIVILVAVASLPKLLPHNRRDPVSAFDLLGVIASLAAATAGLKTLSCQCARSKVPWCLSHGRTFSSMPDRRAKLGELKLYLKSVTMSGMASLQSSITTRATPWPCV